MNIFDEFTVYTNKITIYCIKVLDLEKVFYEEI